MPVHDVSDPACPLPDVLILDASFLLQLPSAEVQTVPSRQQVALAFLRRLGSEAIGDRVLPVAPTITLEECYFKIVQAGFRAEFPFHQSRLLTQTQRKRVSWKDLYKDSPELINKYSPVLHRFREEVQSIPIVTLEPEDLGTPPPELEPRMLHHIENVPILPKDAYLLAIAERLTVPHIATLDADFRSATNWLHVYTVQ